MRNASNLVLFLLLACLLSSCRIGDCGCPMTYEKNKEIILKKKGEKGELTDDRSSWEERVSTDHQPTD